MSLNQFTISVKDAIATLLPIASFASTERASNEIYKHVLIRCNGSQCFAIGSNGAQTVIRGVPLPMFGAEPFDVCIDGHKLRAILSSLKDAVEDEIFITWDDAVATFKIGRSKLTAAVVCPKGFPDPDKLGNEHCSVVLPFNSLLQSLRAVSHSVAVRDVRHYFNGCFIQFSNNGFSVTGSDGHRLSRVCKVLNQNGNGAAEGIAPVKFIDLVGANIEKNTGDVRLRMSSHMVEVTWHGGQIRSTLIDGKYPDVSPFFESEEKTLFVCKKSEVINSLNRLKATVFEKLPAIGIEIENNELKLSTLDDKHQETGVDFVSAEISGSDEKLSINIGYLSDALSQIDDDMVSFGLVKFNSVKVASVSNPEFSAVIAQLRR